MGPQLEKPLEAPGAYPRVGFPHSFDLLGYCFRDGGSSGSPRVLHEAFQAFVEEGVQEAVEPAFADLEEAAYGFHGFSAVPAEDPEPCLVFSGRLLPRRFPISRSIFMCFLVSSLVFNFSISFQVNKSTHLRYLSRMNRMQ